MRKHVQYKFGCRQEKLAFTQSILTLYSQNIPYASKSWMSNSLDERTGRSAAKLLTRDEGSAVHRGQLPQRYSKTRCVGLHFIT
jgi:hypothetical protein